MRHFFCVQCLFLRPGKKRYEEPCVKAYDIKGKLVCNLTGKNANAFFDLLKESLSVAFDDASFAQIPNNSKFLYRYKIFGDTPFGSLVLVYAESKMAHIQNHSENCSVPKSCAWKLSEDTFRMLSNPFL